VEDIKQLVGIFGNIIINLIMVNLHSTTQKLGKYVCQIIHFKSGEKRTLEGVETKSIKQGQFTKFDLKNGSMVLVNDKNVLMIEVFPENENNN